MRGHLARYWWLLVLRGAVAVLFGLVALFWPGATLLALVALFGAYSLTDAAIALTLALTAIGRPVSGGGSPSRLCSESPRASWSSCGRGSPPSCCS